MRTKEEILADPQSTSDEFVALLSREEDISLEYQILQHPNCPHFIWWMFVIKHPIEAMQSPLYLLYTLESPDKWIQTEYAFARRWLDWTLPRLSKQQRKWYDLDCKERTLFVYEKYWPHDSFPRQRIEIQRQLQQKHLSIFQWIAKASAAYVNAVSTSSLSATPTGYPEWDVARATAQTMWDAWKRREHWALAKTATEVQNENVVWLWRRLLYYLFGGEP